MRIADRPRRAWRSAAAVTLPFVAFLVLAGVATAQDDDSYILGVDNRLQMRVHILGEVTRPGEFMVSDDTNIVELLSKAGGPTEFANLGSVMLKRADSTPEYLKADDHEDRATVMKVNIDNYLKKESSDPLPVLNPGDVVTVPRNSMYKWNTAFGMARDLAVVASAYFLYYRTFKE